MARPPKNNCDYFPHDSGMRNHKKVKAIRSKFGVSGYAVWVMTLEHLTGSDGNVFPYSDLEFELLSGDFGVSATEIRAVIDYCISLELLFNKNGFINSESLDERLAPVYLKRGSAKEQSASQKRINGKFATETTGSTVVSVTEMPQNKVKESKGNEKKEKKAPPKGYDVPFVNGSLKAWQEWEQYMKERKKKLTPSTAKKQFKFLGGRPESEIIEIINRSIEKGWQGLFELNNNGNNSRSTKESLRRADATIQGGKAFGSF
jgi:hypothetical protein